MKTPFSFAAAAVMVVCLTTPAAGQRLPDLYLDHVPLAVRSLDEAVQRYDELLGFRIKPGRAHPNGLQNAFVKFPDGSYLELITADRATDDLTHWYRRFLDDQEGGAFLSLRTTRLKAVAESFREAGYEGSLQNYGGSFSILSFPDSGLEPVFLIEYPDPVEDDPALLNHPNTATGMTAVWLPRSTFDALADVRTVFPPARDSAIEVTGGSVIVSPIRSEANVAGVTIRVRSLAAAQEALRRGIGRELAVSRHSRGRSILVPPWLTHGLWIEFLERDAAD